MLPRAFVLLPLVLLAACGTPQEQCIRNNTGELRRIDRLIAETQGNLARGYSYQDQIIVTHEWVPCDGPGFGGPGFGLGGRPTRTGMCIEPDEQTIRREVPIDPSVEARKLENLQARRKALLPAADRAVQACKATYPET